MALGNDVYDCDEQRLAVGAGVLDFTGAGPTTTASAGALNATGTTKGGIMTKSNLRTVAYFAIVGGVVCWMVAHLAPIRG